MSRLLLLALLALVAACSAFSALPAAGARAPVASGAVARSSILMGRGDKRTKKGKRSAGSYGKCRPSKAPEKVRFAKPASYVARNGS